MLLAPMVAVMPRAIAAVAGTVGDVPLLAAVSPLVSLVAAGRRDAVHPAAAAAVLDVVVAAAAGPAAGPAAGHAAAAAAAAEIAYEPAFVDEAGSCCRVTTGEEAPRALGFVTLVVWLAVTASAAAEQAASVRCCRTVFGNACTAPAVGSEHGSFATVEKSRETTAGGIWAASAENS